MIHDERIETMRDPDGYCRSCEKLADEIERLREAYEACSWQLRNVLDSRDARDTEIERLRGLLRDVLTDFDGYLGESLTRRVREALGEQ